MMTTEEKKLIGLCSTDRIFNGLCQVFPEEDGEGLHWSYLGKRMNELAEEVMGMVEVSGCSSHYHDILREAIREARR